jgi:hypothetical protein
VRTIGDGVVEFAGWQNGYGNVVHDQAQQRPDHGLRAPEPHRRRKGARSSRGRRSAPSARPAGRPDRTCISKSKIDGIQQDPVAGGAIVEASS